MAWWDTDAGTPSPAQLRALLALDALYARVEAMTDHSPVAGGIGHDAGAAGSSSPSHPSSSALAGADVAAPASSLAIRDGGSCVRITVPQSAVTPHLSVGVAGFEQRDASGPTLSIHPTRD